MNDVTAYEDALIPRDQNAVGSEVDTRNYQTISLTRIIAEQLSRPSVTCSNREL